MNTAPKIGTRVRYKGRTNCGAFTGTVHAIYPTEYWDEERDRSNGFRPESEWRVGVTVDEVPTPWPYTGTNKIAPAVADLEAI